MSPCDEFSLKALSYLDDRLHGQELDAFRAHLEVCSNCRMSLETERALSQLLHRSRPLYSAPPALRARVAAVLEQHSASIGAHENFYDRLLRRVGSGLTDPVRRVARLRLIMATLAVTALILAFVPSANASGARCKLCGNGRSYSPQLSRWQSSSRNSLGFSGAGDVMVYGQSPVSVSIASIHAGHTCVPTLRRKSGELPGESGSPGNLRKAESENQSLGGIKPVCRGRRRGRSPFRRADVSLPDRPRL